MDEATKEVLVDTAKALAVDYVLVGAATGSVTVAVLSNDKERRYSLGEYFYYAAMNSIMWPGMLYFGIRKSKELKVARDLEAMKDTLSE